MKVFIATPTAGGVVKTKYVYTVLGTAIDLLRRNIGFAYKTVDLSDIMLSRNILASLCMEDEESTHLFFIDSDMSFQSDLCHSLMAADKDVVGAAYPQRKMSKEILQQKLQEGFDDIDEMMACAMEYTVTLEPGEIEIKNGMCQVTGLGMGATLIRKTALRKMIDNDVVRKKRNDKLTRYYGVKDGIYDFFDVIYKGEDYLSEDLSFCDKWAQSCGGRIWAVVDRDIGHVGDMTYGAPYLRRLKRGLI